MPLRDASHQLSLLSYARISADTERDAHGVEGQHRDHRKIAEALGHVIVFEYTDNDKSASKKEVYRDDFEIMVRQLEAGKLADGTPVQGAIIERFDRASRSFGDWERFHEALTAQPGRILIVEGVEKDPYSDGFMWESAIAMVTAKGEPKKISARTLISHRRRAEAGTPVGGTRPFGWLADRRTLDPTEAPVLREAVERYAKGATLNSVVRFVNEAGFKTPAGNPWSARALKQAMTNPRICGYRRYHGELVRDESGAALVGQWEPLVTPALWEAAQARTSPGTRPVSRAGAKHLLVGLLRCGRSQVDGELCLTKLRSGYLTHVPEHRYMCPTKYAGGCSGTARHGPRVEAIIIELMLMRLEVGNEWAKEEVAAWDRTEDLEDARAQLAALRVAWRQKVISNELFFSEAALLERTVGDLERGRQRWHAQRLRLEATPERPRDEWLRRAAVGDTDWMRQTLAQNILSVIVKPVARGAKKMSPNDFEVIWREGF